MTSLLRTIFSALLLSLLFPLSGCTDKGVEIGKTTIQKDTVWQGTIKVTGDVFVPAGVTLTIAPGTTVKFVRIDEKSDRNMFGIDSPYYPQAELIVQGRLIARGTKDNIIVFTSAERDAKPADWGAINLLGGDGNVIEYCKILFAYNGIHAHGASARIDHNEFTKNAVAISVKKEEEAPGVPWFGRPADISANFNYIHNNKGGITFRSSRAVITRNTITDNKFFGIWPKEQSTAEITGNEISENLKGIYFYKSAGVRIAGNNIYDNKEYNLAIADEQNVDVDARNNWFGTTSRDKINELIYDRHSDPSVASILVEPFLKERVKEAGQ
ncbi:right-handed parallel beta-helix repeat-containing protein [Geotalea uraniireducens]|uniref:Parallel beta-helix repeat n=1 Tax=Geotalea uraniireducens (strain Rf4) TaxID=351605 RepID=A5G573_GEOUR|nr:right-handed parallel beta-helix repeat-containing protein [Geotalea uraniireducens]ABQ26941.1 Parallel beta-helix repeat [Geotalea uraniireducens Rf4]